MLSCPGRQSGQSIDGEVVSIAETLHAYGLRSEDGIEVMVHFGLETVALKENASSAV